jgi:ADP-dependent phosphofructokinase/glucokinase
MSMNEEELQYTLKMFGVPVDISDVLSCLKGVEFLRAHCGVRKGVIVHTKDYALYAGDTQGFHIEQGMVCGSLLATAKAAYGNYGTDEQIRTILKNPLSEHGIRNQEIIRSHGLEDHVIVVPTFYLDRPKYTIGLGDSFTGGMQLCFNNCLQI